MGCVPSRRFSPSCGLAQAERARLLQDLSEVRIEQALLRVKSIPKTLEGSEAISESLLYLPPAEKVALVEQRRTTMAATEVVVRNQKLLPARVPGRNRIKRHDGSAERVGEQGASILVYAVAHVHHVGTVAPGPIV